MRSSLSRVALTLAAGFLVAACSPTSSPSPSPIAASAPSSSAGASPAPSRSSAPLSPAPLSSTPGRATGWPIPQASEPMLGPDGTVYFVADSRAGEVYLEGITAIDAAGYVKSGWPVEARPDFQFGARAIGPDGSLYIEECGSPADGCVLHRLGTDGRESPGWPFAPGPDFACSDGYSCLGGLEIGSNGIAYVSGAGDGPRRQLLAIDASGGVKPGWPVSVEFGEWTWTQMKVGPDGTLFFGWSGLPGVKSVANLWAIAPDGSTRSGWPVTVPGVRGFHLGPQGTVVTWSWVDDEGELCFDPRRTVFTVIGPDGRTLPGWPLGSTGFASAPVVDADGTVYYVSETGKVYAHDRSGEIKAGWPVQVAGALHGVCVGSIGPTVAPDGTIVVPGDAVVALSPDGSVRPGWPYQPAGQLRLPCFDSDCSFNHAGPVTGQDGTVYVVLYREGSGGAGFDVVAVDARAQVKPGWPYRLPIDPAANETVDGLIMSPDGRLLVRGGSLLLSLDPDGRLSD